MSNAPDRKRKRMTQKQTNEMIEAIAVMSLNLLIAHQIVSPLAGIYAQAGRLEMLAELLEGKLKEFQVEEVTDDPQA